MYSTAHSSIYMHTAGHLHATGRVAPTSRAAFERQIDTAEPAHATCTPYLAVYSPLYFLSEVVPVTTW